jgi:hypothetical protein
MLSGDRRGAKTPTEGLNQTRAVVLVQIRRVLGSFGRAKAMARSIVNLALISEALQHVDQKKH